jgi:ankyrin repeat protein
MIENGVNLNCVNVVGETPLMMSAMKGLTESARFLIDHHANVNATNK